ncbi:DUF2306 domain-containing protein [Subtercola sp. PAMC28395]|uniref:DUF2306 domain-containing protein n=1 Tax=Subtercola sp. PAMC28395 TaxID=2846775 RepID=UPI001C0ABFEB|nr:DUF2306 domain-containing protein [Subtercola sp. PAMC28395]QWT23885.1 DUF2306 domain-containing protein [Subtercola sp. PAMC28395]
MPVNTPDSTPNTAQTILTPLTAHTALTAHTGQPAQTAKEAKEAKEAKTRSSQPPIRRTRVSWLAPTGLILLSLIPLLAGAARVAELTGGAAETADNSRFLDSPIPVFVHIVGVTVFSLLGAFQFVPTLRRAGHRWHRVSGTILIPAGLLTALSGMWMVVFYPHPVGDGLALSALRLLFGAAMVAGILLGIRAISKRDFVSHGDWMTRAYAIGMGAGTQAILLIPGAIIFGKTHELSRTLLMGAAWVVNLAVAELIIRRRARKAGGVAFTHVPEHPYTA